ncbi:proteic killer suppression protein [Granulicella rosea]|uniref:Proteic killer suppression protein n=1 Tax=Granulicella rosea TaxID=474952 RepID=A0A239IK41_9BACT|nr:type II toxin-antitoxin system RelE/ParE family toxin [Granulicella rosea]SNS93782.1 proteic killer suppression protein [Granulicella rosea]
MIKSFRHAGLEDLFKTGSKKGINPSHATKLNDQLFALNNAKVPVEMNLPSWRLHALKGDMPGHWSVKVNGNWRLTFRFEAEMQSHIPAGS